MIKLVFRLGLALLLILIGLVVILTMSLGRVVRNGVVTLGPEITQVKVELADAKVSALSGSGELTGLVIGNPEGFSTSSAIEVGHVKLVLQPRSVLSDKVVIRSLQVSEPVITLEGSLRGNNLSALLRNIEARTGGGASTGQDPEAEGKKLQVDEFILRDAKLNLSLSMLRGQTATVSLPQIELRDLGQGPEGITAAELSGLILRAVLERATVAASGHLKGVGGELGDTIRQGAGGVRDAAEKVMDLFKKPE